MKKEIQLDEKILTLTLKKSPVTIEQIIKETSCLMKEICQE